MHTYIPRGVCSRQIDVELDGDTIKSVQFTGGCDGNLKAISKLVAGQNVDDIVAMMEGHTCGRRSTSSRRPNDQGHTRGPGEGRRAGVRYRLYA